MLPSTFAALAASALGVGLSLLTGARASALTTAIAGNERLCFFADVDKAGEKIGVRPSCFAPCKPRFLSLVL